MSKEQAKGFFEAISEDKQLAEEVNAVMSGQATNQEKAKELLSLAKRHNFNFTEDELKRSLSRDDLADIAGGSGVGQAVVIMATTLGLGGTPAPLHLQIEQQAAIVQQQAGNAQNEDGKQDNVENEVPVEVINEEEDAIQQNIDDDISIDDLPPSEDSDVTAESDESNFNDNSEDISDTKEDEIRELIEEEIAERQQREEQERRELEATGLMNRVNRLNTLYYRLLYAPQSHELMDIIRSYIVTVEWTFDRGIASLRERISIADALIHEAEEMLQRAEQQRGEETSEELSEELREAIQQGLDALALILQRTHTGLPGKTDLYTDVQTYLANRESYSRKERIARAEELLNRTRAFHNTLDWDDRMFLDDVHELFKSDVWSWDGDEQAVLEERLEKNALPWLASIRMQSCAPGEPELALEIQEFLTTIDGDFTDEHLEKLSELLDRAHELMMDRARAYHRFDIDQLSIRNNDLQLAQMLGIDKGYIQEKIKKKTVASREDFDGFIELPNGDKVALHFFVGSGTLVLTGSGNTVIGSRYSTDSLFEQLEKSGIVFEVEGADGYSTAEQLPTRDYPFVVRNLIIGNGITKIDEAAFNYAHSLRSVYLMGPVQFIGCNAFGNDNNLVEVGFAQPEVLARIDERAFISAHSLTSINLPLNANIAEDAFGHCKKLKEQGCPYCKSHR